MKLLERTTRRVAPTAEGERFIPIAERLIRDFDTAISDLNGAAERRSGHVSIAAVPSFAAQLMPGIVKAFVAQYPGLSVHLTDDNSLGVQRRLLRNEVDFAIGSRFRLNLDLVFKPLVQDRVELVCHRDHPLAREEGDLEWRELQNHQFIDSGIQGLMPLEGLPDRPKFEFSTTTTLFAMVRANIGVTILPTLATRDLHADLTTRPMADPLIRRDIFLITRKDWSLSPASAAMIEVLSHEILRIVGDLASPHVQCKF